MAILNQTNPTLMDVMKRTDPAGGLYNLVEPMKQKTPLLEDMTWVEANSTHGHIISSRTALPIPTWRKFNQGVAPSKSRSDTSTETMGMLDARSEVDCALAETNGNEAAWRASEDAGFVQSYGRVLEDALFYSSSKVSPEQVLGLSPRLDATAGNPAASQIVKMDGSASGNDQASMWLVVWGPRTVYGIYPKGSQAGLKMTDLGKQLVDDGTGKRFVAYVSDFSWRLGVVVEDSRYLVRLCNIDTGNLTQTGTALYYGMVAMVNAAQDLDSGRPVIYTNRKMLTYLQTQAIDSTKNSTLTYDEVGGHPVTRFMGIPIKRTDALINGESPIA